MEINNNGFNGLVFKSKATGSVLSSLSIVNAKGSGVTLDGSRGTIIVGNYIGLALDGSTIAGNRGNGLELKNATANTIGGIAAQDRNVISGNRLNGVLLDGSSSNAVFGNFIGTDESGALDRGNLLSGIVVTSGSKTNVIGADGDGNVISGNDAYGVLIQKNSHENTVRDNIIGLVATGNAALGNALDGLKIQNSNRNLIGQDDPTAGVTFYPSTDVLSSPTVNGWQGIRGGDSAGQYIITGTAGVNALLYEGPLDSLGTGYTFLYQTNNPNQTIVETTAYGPDNLAGNEIGIVGTYKNSDYATAAVEINGFVFQGTTADLGDASHYQTIDYPGAKYTYVHSLANGLAVGNYDSVPDHGKGNLPYGPGHAFIHDVNSHTFLTDVVFPNSKSNTVYGIWHNSGSSYTLVGGFSPDNVNNFTNQRQPIGKAFIVDYDSATGKFTHWKAFDYPFGINFDTHFEGVSSVEAGVYTLSADSFQAGTNSFSQASFVTVRRNADGSFGASTWTPISYGSGTITSNDSVYGNAIVGVAFGNNTIASWQATVQTEFHLSNVISGNGGNGISLVGANDNQIAMNYIGTDSTGLVDLGNQASGIAMSGGANGNMIGGVVSGGNSPTNGSFVQPPLGNVISGNDAYGVFIFDHASDNQLSGNFIGTEAQAMLRWGTSWMAWPFKMLTAIRSSAAHSCKIRLCITT